MHVVIVAALLPEARAIARAFQLSERFSQRFVTGGWVTVGLVGPGARHLEGVAEVKPQALIMAGLAGALAPELRVGDVVIQGTHRPLQGLAHRVVAGNLATARGIVATLADKAALFRETGALAVDMETKPAQQYAESMNIPFLAVRAILDSAAEPLDPAFLALVDAEGRPRVGRALGHLAKYPTRLPGMLHIRRATKVALTHLAATLQAIVNSGWPENP
jgi:adenosylhomocysteine nucleosidase